VESTTTDSHAKLSKVLVGAVADAVIYNSEIGHPVTVSD